MPVTHFDLALRRPLAQGRAFGDVGPYEELKGRLRFAVDPAHPSNARITDVGLAPRNRDGRVEFAADVSILAPVDPARASGRVLLDVVNRGNTVAVPNFNHATRPVFGAGADPNPAIDVGDGFLMRRGWIVVSCGWQCDVPEIGGLFRLHAPQALEAGQPVKGRIYVNLQAPEAVPHFLLSDRGHLAHPAADLGERDAVLLVRDQLDGPPQTIPRARWRFARAVDGRVVDDPRHVWLEGGFEKGRLYQVAYTAVGAPVLGLSFAALRDCVAWLKHEPTSPAGGHARWAYAYGRSQTGRFLRTLVHFDLNLDEQGREALDGIIANVAGGMRGEFNQRFGQNSKDRPQMMAQIFPSTDTPTTDIGDIGDGGVTGAVHARLDARGSRLKVFYTNTSAEYHRGDASLVHTDPDGRRDVAHGPHTRVYHFTGTEHGVGIWPPTDTTPVAADPSGWTERSQNVRNTINYCRLLRACLLNLDRWVTEGVEPPPSRHPRIDDGTAVPPEALAKAFDRIPGAHYPRHHARAGRRDFGGDPEQRVLTKMPPVEGAPYGTLVSAVDDDGNETAGIAVPEIRVPLAAYTGWSLRHPDIGGAEQLLYFAGATLPFAKTAAERSTSGDPRPSIAERYASRADYLERVRKAALELVAARYLLEEDVEVSVTFAARAWDWLAGA